MSKNIARRTKCMSCGIVYRGGKGKACPSCTKKDTKTDKPKGKAKR